jgi:hypothetical protein
VQFEKVAECENAIAHIAATPELAVFAATSGDTITPGVDAALKGAVAGSPHPRSTVKIYPRSEHGLPMFAKNAELEPALKRELLGD